MTPDEQRIVDWLRELADEAARKPQPVSWPKGSWNARQLGIQNYLHSAANAIQSGAHRKAVP